MGHRSKVRFIGQLFFFITSKILNLMQWHQVRLEGRSSISDLFLVRQKQGKQKAEKDEFLGAAFYHVILLEKCSRS